MTTKTFPSIHGRCPACRGDSLFVGTGGWITCSRLDCPNPSAADKLLHGEHVGAATPLVCSDERHTAKVAALQADLDRYEEVLGDLNETLVDRAQQAARAEAAIARVRAAVAILGDDAAAARKAGHEQAAYALEGAVLRIRRALDQPKER